MLQQVGRIWSSVVQKRGWESEPLEQGPLKRTAPEQLASLDIGRLP